MRLNSVLVEDGVRESFVTDMNDLFRPDLGAIDRAAGAEAVRAFLRQCMTASEARGFALQGEIIKFTFLALHLGQFFEVDPLLAGMRTEALWGDDGVHPNVGLNRMFDSADLMIAEGLVGADHGFAPGFPEACAAHAGGDPLARAEAICTQANPRRAHAFGPDGVRAALVSGWRDLEDNHPRFFGHPLEWMICSYFLGHGFARNPLYAWMPWRIAEGGLGAVRRELHE